MVQPAQSPQPDPFGRAMFGALPARLRRFLAPPDVRRNVLEPNLGKARAPLADDAIFVPGPFASRLAPGPPRRILDRCGHVGHRRRTLDPYRRPCILPGGHAGRSVVIGGDAGSDKTAPPRASSTS